MQDKAFEVLKSLPSMGIQPTVEVPTHVEFDSNYSYIHTYIHTYMYKCLADEGEQCYSVSFMESSYIRNKCIISIHR